jgi:hypothetical protein
MNTITLITSFLALQTSPQPKPGIPGFNGPTGCEYRILSTNAERLGDRVDLSGLEWTLWQKNSKKGESHKFRVFFGDYRGIEERPRRTSLTPVDLFGNAPTMKQEGLPGGAQIGELSYHNTTRFRKAKTGELSESTTVFVIDSICAIALTFGAERDSGEGAVNLLRQVHAEITDDFESVEVNGTRIVRLRR